MFEEVPAPWVYERSKGLLGPNPIGYLVQWIILKVPKNLSCKFYLVGGDFSSAFTLFKGKSRTCCESSRAGLYLAQSDYLGLKFPKLSAKCIYCLLSRWLVRARVVFGAITSFYFGDLTFRFVLFWLFWLLGDFIDFGELILSGIACKFNPSSKLFCGDFASK